MIVILIMLVCVIACGIMLIVLARNAALQKKQATFVDQERFEFIYSGGELRGGTLDRVLVNSKGLRYVKKEDIDYPVKFWVLKDPSQGWSNKPEAWRENNETGDIKSVKIGHAILPKDRLPKDELDKMDSGLSVELQRRWGWFYVGITYPLVHVLEFKIERARLVAGGEATRERVRGLVEKTTSDEKPAFVKSFLIRFPRPIIASDVEFGDKYTADIAINIKCRVVIPLRTIPTWKDKFYEQLELTVIGGIGEVCHQMTYGDFIELFPIGPASGFHERVLSRLNLTLVPTLGVEIEDGWIIDRELSGESRQQEKALQAEKTAQLNVKATIATAEGEAKAAKARAIGVGDAAIEQQTREGKAEFAKAQLTKQAAQEIGIGAGLALQAQIEALIKGGLTAETAARLVAQKLRMQALENTSLGTLVEGGSGANIGVMVAEKESGGGQPGQTS